ncbi:DUF2971 domain-containing protein [Aliifodinibius sp. S!AR15-10]|uniref:DUF2971 domain-containing protein n=1 Tax=Aliifodinibius sp. S!AR15-10 TaxID=2950437 RepID=UPI002854ED14|nr:DUF2971 domain-containing protein [Aliifodinibius sp. S!AR15-10]MDR8394381.1 DUF2971 domain-containing protein [Aliifodinibius sp. S!AR15-10]
MSEYNPIGENLDQLPPLLYKYKSFDKDGYGISMATKGELFFPSPGKFNDPFETYFLPKSKMIELPEDELKEYIHKKTKQRFAKETRKKRIELESIAFDRAQKFKEDPSLAAEEMLEHQYEQFGILSLVKEPTSLPMWAYYSNNHSGMCIGLKTEALAKFQKFMIQEHGELLLLHDVIYTEEIPEVNIDTPLDDSETEVKESELVHYTKSDHWQHEDEIRLIFWKHPNTTCELGPGAIGEVMVGIKADDDDVNELISKLKSNNSNATVKRAKKSSYEYGVDFEVIEEL